MAFRRMHNLRSYYSASIPEFLNQSTHEILGIIHTNDGSAETTIQQSNTWEAEVLILKSQLKNFTEGHIIFEYTIPRMGKRVDTVVLYRNIVFLLEFLNGVYKICNDGKLRFLVPEVNSSGEDLKSIFQDLCKI